MKAIYTLGASLLFLLLHSACRESIDIPREMETKTPTLSCLAQTGSASELAVYLSRTSLWEPTALPGASVSLSVNGTERAQGQQEIRPTTSGYEIYTRYLMTTSLTPGDEVVLKVTTPQGEELTASQRVPQEPILLSATMGEYVSGSYRSYYPLKVTLRDHPQESNYYRIVLKVKVVCYAPEDTNRQRPIYIPTSYVKANYRKDFILCDGSPRGIVEEDADIGELSGNSFSNRYLTFDDHLFSGQEASINLELESVGFSRYEGLSAIDPRQYPNGVEVSHFELSLQLEGITQDAHRYYRSLSGIRDDRYDPEDPFTTPIKLYSNVLNGTGIFAIGTRTKAITFEGTNL